jgi:ubiquinone/menaquinone biosynthesis C-methylase UbiE
MRKIQYFLPPILIDTLRFFKKKIKKQLLIKEPNKQSLELYNDPEMAKILDEWGERNAWIEIQHIFHDKKKYKILDIACGTGKVIEILMSKIQLNNLFGCDISDFLIGKAIERGIDKNKLKICDATKLPYNENEFDYNYSIGSLEHFTKEGIKDFLISSRKVTKYSGFHMIPVSRDGKDHGWIENYQSYFNNSVGWWSSICKDITKDFYFIDSSWEDEISVGKWLIIIKDKND